MDAYKIGVSIALSNGMSPVLALISKDLMGINSKVKDIENNFKKWALAVGGVAGVMAGGMILRGLSKIADKGNELLHQQQMMRIAGMQNKDVVEATNKAWETSRRIQTTTASENLKHIRELRYATGDTEGAMSILDPVTKSNAILNSIKGGAGGTDQVFELVKALEQKGLATSEKREEFLSYVNAMTKVVESTGGRVTPQMFQSTFKYGRTSMLGWNEQFVTEILPRLIQSMSTSGGGGGGGGSGGPGNALMTGFRQMVSGVMSKPSAALFQEMGWGSASHQKGTTKSFTKVRDDLVKSIIHDPYEAIQSMMPDLVKKYGRDQDKLIQALGIAFPVRTWGAVGTEFGLQGRYMMGDASPYEKDRRLTRGAMSLDEAWKTISQKDPDTIKKMYGAQHDAMDESVGVALAPAKLEVIKALTIMFTEIGRFASANPEAIRAIGYTLAVLAGALVVGGIVALAAAIGTIGWVAAGAAAAIAGLVAAFMWIKNIDFGAKWAAFAKDMPTVAKGFEIVGSAISMILNPLTTLAGLFRQLAGAISAIHMPSWLGGSSGSAGSIPGGDGIPSYQKQNYVPPARGSGAKTHTAAVYLDGAKVGDYVMRHISDSMSLPTQGSAHFDATRHSFPTDTALG